MQEIFLDKTMIAKIFNSKLSSDIAPVRSLGAINPLRVGDMQLYLETLHVYVEPKIKPPVPVQQTVNEQPNNSPNFAGLVVFIVGIVVLAIWGLGIIGEGSESNISPLYSMVFILIVGGPILIILAVFSLMLTTVTNTKKGIPNVQTASIQGLSTEEKWGLRVKARRQAMSQAMSQPKPSSTTEKWGLRMISPVFIVIGIWILNAVSSVGSESIATMLGVISILSGVLLFLVTLRTNTEEIESE